jgi:hypothetical protein
MPLVMVYAFCSSSEMARSFECLLWCARKALDTADIVREAIYRHLSRYYTKSGEIPSE